MKRIKPIPHYTNFSATEWIPIILEKINELIAEINAYPTKPSGNNRTNHSGLSGFDAFWSIYPRKVSKVTAVAAWKKLNPDPGIVQNILISLDSWKKTDQWCSEDGKFIPHAATWLNQRRFEDELVPTQKMLGMKQRPDGTWYKPVLPPNYLEEERRRRNGTD